MADLATCRRFEMKAFRHGIKEGNKDWRGDLRNLHIVGNQLLSIEMLSNTMLQVVTCDIRGKLWDKLRLSFEHIGSLRSVLIEDQLFVVPAKSIFPMVWYDLVLKEIRELLPYQSPIHIVGLRDFVLEYVGYEQKVLLFGGQQRHFVANELFVFSLATLKWEVVDEYKGLAPPPMYSAASCVDRDRLYVFGGTLVTGKTAAGLHVLELALNQYIWSTVEHMPNPKHTTALLVNCGNRLVLLGGSREPDGALGVFEKAEEQLILIGGSRVVRANDISKGTHGLARAVVRTGKNILVFTVFDSHRKYMQGIEILPLRVEEDEA